MSASGVTERRAAAGWTTVSLDEPSSDKPGSLKSSTKGGWRGGAAASGAGARASSTTARQALLSSTAGVAGAWRTNSGSAVEAVPMSSADARADQERRGSTLLPLPAVATKQDTVTRAWATGGLKVGSECSLCVCVCFCGTNALRTTPRLNACVHRVSHSSLLAVVRE